MITPSFFGYEDEIADEFVKQGWDVTLVDERPSNSAVARAVYRVAPALARRRVRAYYERKFAEIADLMLDVVLVVKAEVVPRKFVERLRQRHPNAVFAFYAYDAIANSSGWVGSAGLFDLRFSFDPEDVRRDPTLQYLPLFAGPAFRPIRAGEGSPKYDVSFIGTLHSDRFRFVSKVAAGVDRSFLYFYVPARWLFWLRRLSYEYRHVPAAYVRYDKLSRAQVAEVFRRSRVIVDLQREGQTGLTMRTFEALASGARLLTTNRHASELLHRLGPNRVYVVDADDDRDGVRALARALSEPASGEDLAAAIEPYRLRAWVHSILAACEATR